MIDEKTKDGVEVMLQPVTNKHRAALSLHGVWEIAPVPDGYVPVRPLVAPRAVGVPASYDELYPDSELRNHVGSICYERAVAVPRALEGGELRLRFGAGGNRAAVYADGIPIGIHEGGFLPYEAVLPPEIASRDSFRLSVILDNRLDFATLPIGEVVVRDGKRIQQYNHDFMNETGLHRDVFLCALPRRPIRDIFVRTRGHEVSTAVSWDVETEAERVEVDIVSPTGVIVANGHGPQGTATVVDPVLWDIGRGNLYTLSVRTENDAYDQPFGIRDVELRDGTFLLNGTPVRFRGFGMHEDHVTIGKGSVAAHEVRDFALLDWIGANSFRTSHYPYAERMYDLADRAGVLVIDEVAAVGLNFWSSRPVFVPGTVDERTLATHKRQLTELILRDRNHPSVVMVSVANEATTFEEGAIPYFTEIFRHARTLTDLPLMIVENVGAAEEKVASLADVVGLNKYLGWYVDHGDLSGVSAKLAKELFDFHAKFGKPILLTEFGADTIVGLHRLPAVPFSEEFQVEFLKSTRAALADLPFVIGEHVWNFADFMTKPGLFRVDGNKKGVFTRDRQPKMAAHYLREAWRG